MKQYRLAKLKAGLLAASLFATTLAHAEAPSNDGINMPTFGGGVAVDVPAEPDKVDVKEAAEMTTGEARRAEIMEIEGALTSLFQGDYESALEQFKEASKNGNALAMNSVGVMYGQGLGIEENQEEARLWYQVAVDHDSHDAIYNLAVMYADGIGGEVDLEKAKALFDKACEYGDVEACEFSEELAGGA